MSKCHGNNANKFSLPARHPHLAKNLNLLKSEKSTKINVIKTIRKNLLQIFFDQTLIFRCLFEPGYPHVERVA